MTGHHFAAADLMFGKTSEPNALQDKNIQGALKNVSGKRAFIYDKGVRGIQTPNDNFIYIPFFLAPAKGKTKFTGEEAGGNKATAVNRYVVEIGYTRVKDWSLLAGIIPRERFHLMNSTWLWALGFSNLVQGFLRPPPGVDARVQPLYHYSLWLGTRLDEEDMAAAADDA